MIPLIGTIVAVYAVARLLQVPIEHSPSPRGWLVLISIPAILIIMVLTLLLLTSGAAIDLPRVPRQP